jgi:hypothetical protein
MAYHSDAKKGALKELVKKAGMKDIGHSYKEHMIAPSKPKEKHYPSITVKADQLPYLKEKEVGDFCTMVVEAKVVGHEMSRSDSGRNRDEYRLEIIKVGSVG